MHSRVRTLFLQGFQGGTQPDAQRESQSPLTVEPEKEGGFPSAGDWRRKPAPCALDSPRVINVDKNAAYPPAIDSLTQDQIMTETTELRPVKYLNNIVELSASIHQTIGQSRNGMRAHSTRLWRSIRGYETMNMIRIGQIQGVACMRYPDSSRIRALKFSELPHNLFLLTRIVCPGS